MILQCQPVVPTSRSSEKPWLVMLHGLLGNSDDWQALRPFLSDWPLLLVDLPGHGASTAITVQDFAAMNHQLMLTLQAHGIERYWLVGYSLGGRIAMHYATHSAAIGLQGIVVEGGNPGLQDDSQRQARREHDAQWAQRWRHEPMPVVLEDWYQQAVFADLSATQRAALVTARAGNSGPAIATMLEATSLGRQPWLLDALQRRRVPFAYLCGAQDLKFQTLAREHALPLMSVPDTGHNAHRGNPMCYAQHMRDFMLATA